jgi:hypothetical protein
VSGQRPRNRGTAEVAALLRQVSAVYAAAGAPPRAGGPARLALTAPARHSLTLATLADLRAGAHRSYLAAMVECRVDTASGLRDLLRLVGANAAATVLHWAIGGSGPAAGDLWTKADVIAAARGGASMTGSVPTGMFRGLAALQPNVYRLAPGAQPTAWGQRSRTRDEIAALLQVVETIYFEPVDDEVQGFWGSDELHALLLTEIEEEEAQDAAASASYLETLVAWGLDTAEGLACVMRLQGAGTARTTLRWLLVDDDERQSWPDDRVLAEAGAAAWWAKAEDEGAGA